MVVRGQVRRVRRISGYVSDKCQDRPETLYEKVTSDRSLDKGDSGKNFYGLLVTFLEASHDEASQGQHVEEIRLSEPVREHRNNFVFRFRIWPKGQKVG